MNIHDHRGIQAFLDYLGLSIAPEDFVPRYNVAPGAMLTTVVGGEGVSLRQMKWGITPSWAAKQPGVRDLINARAETVWEKTSFRRLIPEYRCIVPVNGFYEWSRSRGTKIPFKFNSIREPAFGIAAIYNSGMKGEGEVCLLTTSANRVMAPVHDRMPVIIRPDGLRTWLGPATREDVDPLLQAVDDDYLECCEISSYVNNAAHEGPDCIKCVENPG